MKVRCFYKYVFISLFSVLISVSIVLGGAVYKTNSISCLFDSGAHIAKTLLSFLLYTLLAIVICTSLVYIFTNYFSKVNITGKRWKFLDSKYIFVGCWVFIFLSWLPCYLSYYPGILSYDSNVQTLMARRIWEWTTHHPVIHTFLWKLCLSAGYRLCIEPIVIYALLQMLVLSCCLALTIKYLINRGCGNLVFVIALCFYAFNPIISIFSFVMTKDVYFSAFLLLFSVCLAEMVRDSEQFLKKPVWGLGYVFCGVMSCLLRNNFVYAYILLLPVLFVVLRRECRKLLPSLVLPIVISMLCTSFVYPLCDIGNGDTKESLSVPMQQLALVAETKQLDEQLLDDIHRFIPDTSVYNPRFADPIKYVFSESEFAENKADFFKLWWDVFLQYPVSYIDAFLSLNIPFWYLDSDLIDIYSQREYLETYIYQGSYTFERAGFFPGLYGFYEKIASGEALENVPVVSKLFSISTPIWLVLFTVVCLLCKKEYKRVCVPFIYVFLWITYMAGPVSCLRYVFPLILAYPFFLWMCVNRAKDV